MSWERLGNNSNDKMYANQQERMKADRRWAMAIRNAFDSRNARPDDFKKRATEAEDELQKEKILKAHRKQRLA